MTFGPPRVSGVRSSHEAPKFVVSTTLEVLGWSSSTLVQGDVAAGVSEIKHQDGGDILVAGSRTLVHTLMEHDLVDEYRLMVLPVVLGSGRRLFPETPDKTVLSLTDTVRFDTGVQVHVYAPAGQATRGPVLTYVAREATSCLSTPSRGGRSVSPAGSLSTCLTPTNGSSESESTASGSRLLDARLSSPRAP